MVFYVLQSTLFFTCVSFCSFLFNLMHFDFIGSIMGIFFSPLFQGSWDLRTTNKLNSVAPRILLALLPSKLFSKHLSVCVFIIDIMITLHGTICLFCEMTLKSCATKACQQQRFHQLFGVPSKKIKIMPLIRYPVSLRIACPFPANSRRL